MNAFIIASIITCSLALSAQAEEVRAPVDPQHQPTQMFKAEVFESDDAILFSIPEKKVQYYITKPNNPAYPAMIENQVLGRHEDTRFKANSFAKPDNAEVAKWLEEINKINQDRMAKLKGNQ